MVIPMKKSLAAIILIFSLGSEFILAQEKEDKNFNPFSICLTGVNWPALHIFPAAALKEKLTACATTQIRAFTRWDASVKDYQCFPSRKIESSRENVGEKPFQFTRQPDNYIEEFLQNEWKSCSLQTTVNKTKTQALIVIKDNSIVIEKYGKNYNESSIVTSFSVAKSIDSAIIGCLIDSGKIADVNQPVTDFLPELLKRDKSFSKITIKHLLTMSSGILYEEKLPRMDNTETYFNPNLRNLALTNTLIKEEPGKHFLYNNYNPLLLGLIIERVTGESVSSYLSRSIWSKIGSESDASWSLDSNEDAFEKMESGINAIALDFARFGCLYRDGGMAGGKVVISKKWINESLAEEKRPDDYLNESWGKRIAKGVSEDGGYYGYFWYVIRRKNAENDFFAFGNKGQVIYISPASGLVCVRFGQKDGMPVWNYISAFYNLASNTINSHLKSF